MATKNAIGSNIPIEIAKGGTNATSFATTDGTAYFDSSKVNVTATGTAAQVLTSNGASAPTYQDALIPGGGLVFIQSQTVSGVTAVDFTSIGSYYNYLILFYEATTSPTNRRIGFNYSTDGGSSWTNGGPYSLKYYPYNGTGVTNTTNTANAIFIYLSDSAVSYNDGFVWLYNLNTAAPPMATVQSWQKIDGGSDSLLYGANWGYYDNAAPVTYNAIRIKCDTVATLSGTYVLYGVSGITV